MANKKLVYRLGKDYYTPENLYWGALGEKPVAKVIRMLYPAERGFKVTSNSFKSIKDYCSGEGMDVKVRNLFEIEVKNLKQQDKPYGTDFVKRHILSRARNCNLLKILIITYINLLTKAGITLLHKHGWIILEVGERLTEDFLKSKKKLYSLRAKIRSVCRKFSSVSNSSISNRYSSAYSYLTRYNSNRAKTNINNKYDTPILNSKELGQKTVEVTSDMRKAFRLHCKDFIF